MKLTLYAICAMLMLFGGVGCTTEGGQSAPTAVVTVQYVNPGSFTDFSVQGRNVQDSASTFTQQVTGTLTPVMGSRFPAYFLTLRFTDIDLAGRRSSGSSARIVRNRTPARLSFDYLLQDKSGHAVASGSQRLVDNGRRSQPGNRGTLADENRMLQRWLQTLSVNH